MKIGILTFHNAINHGAVLQTYATQELLRGMGHEVEVIDYRNQAVEAYYDKFRFHLGVLLRKRKIRYLVSPFLFWLQRRAFSRFIKNHLNISKNNYNINNINQLPFYDIIFIGSDQVWNPTITHGFDCVYWGKDIKNKTKKIVGWSVSAGQACFKISEREEIKKNLRNFYKISVREKGTKLYLSNLTNDTIPQTLDPTLLLPTTKWDKLCKTVKHNKYILTYGVNYHDKKKAIKIAKRLSTKINMDIIQMKFFIDSGNIIDIFKSCSPIEFLSYIKEADYIVTTSFHGTVFSILFQKQFFCLFDEDNRNLRINDILKKTQLEERIIYPNEDFANIHQIDYIHKDISSKLDEYIGESYSFLTSVFV